MAEQGLDKESEAELKRLEGVWRDLTNRNETDGQSQAHTEAEEGEYVLKDSDFLSLVNIYKKLMEPSKGNGVGGVGGEGSNNNVTDHLYPNSRGCLDRLDSIWKNLTLYTAARQRGLPKSIYLNSEYTAIIPENCALENLIPDHPYNGPCPYCPLTGVRPNKRSTIKRHLARFHLSHCITFKGSRHLLCKLKHDVSIKRSSHYHCKCGKIMRVKNVAQAHIMAGCKAQKELFITEPPSVSPQPSPNSSPEKESKCRIVFKSQPTSSCGSCGQVVPDEIDLTEGGHNCNNEAAEFTSNLVPATQDECRNGRMSEGGGEPSRKRIKIESRSIAENAELTAIKEMLAEMNTTLNSRLSTIEEKLEAVMEKTNLLEEEVLSQQCSPLKKVKAKGEKKKKSSASSGGVKVEEGAYEVHSIIKEGYSTWGYVPRVAQAPAGCGVKKVKAPLIQCPLCLETSIKPNAPKGIRRHLKAFHEKHSFTTKGHQFLLCRLKCGLARTSHYHCLCGRIRGPRSAALKHVEQCEHPQVLLPSSQATLASEIPPPSSTRGRRGKRRPNGNLYESYVDDNSYIEEESVTEVILDTGGELQVVHATQDQLEHLEAAQQIQILHENHVTDYNRGQQTYSYSVPISGSTTESYRVVYADS